LAIKFAVRFFISKERCSFAEYFQTMAALTLSPSLPKEQIFTQVQVYIKQQGYRVTSADQSRPWGGFFVIDGAQAAEFAAQFFPEIAWKDMQLTQRLSPKFLVVAPGKRLSWQYHFRRAELWKLIAGEAGIVRSSTDEEGTLANLKMGELVSLPKGERHRLVGTTNWGVVSEIWQHTDAGHPSDEADIVRLQDDFGR
jgi:mannose-6-phosphate isomerase-like protein (cupin superfamily)